MVPVSSVTSPGQVEHESPAATTSGRNPSQNQQIGIAPDSLSPPELAALLETERRGAPFVACKDGDGRLCLFPLEDLERATIGRLEHNQIALGWDPEVSRTHVQLELVGGDWTLVDDGLSRNGSFVNGVSVPGRRRLVNGDVLRVGRTALVFRAPGISVESTAVAGAPVPAHTARMDFRILGPLEVLDGKRALSVAGRKQRALLALLLIHANETLSTDRIADELWAERPPATAAKSVQVHIFRLRKALAFGAGEQLLVTRQQGYELRVDPDQVDSRRFERLVAEGRSELAADRPEAAASTLEQALALWRGAPFSDLAREPFAQRESARLEDVRVAAQEQMIEAKLALGGHAEVVGQLEKLIGEQPYREGLRAQLMLALYRCDRQADALQAYQDARRTLVDDLGIEPGSRLRDLEQAILEQSPALARYRGVGES
jgi:DNA-binding SARP family transcriptional activator